MKKGREEEEKVLDGSLSPFEEGFFFLSPVSRSLLFPGISAKEKWEGGISAGGDGYEEED